MKLIINQRNPGGFSKRNNGEVSGQEARATCQGWRAVLSDYTCTKLDEVCKRLTAAVAGIRGEAKKLIVISSWGSIQGRGWRGDVS